MAKKKKQRLRPGKGAIANILTKFIKPKQPLPDNSNKHRSNIVLEKEGQDENNKRIVYFYYDGDEEKNLMYANHRYVNILKEGDHMLLFEGPGEPRLPDSNEPNVKWQYSQARRLLVQDINDGIVEFNDDDTPTMDLKEIFGMHIEYSEYNFEKFAERLQSIWKKTKGDINRAGEDLEALEDFIQYNEVSYMNKFGMIQWQGSEAQEQAWVDLAEDNIRDFGYRHVFDTNPVYNENFTFQVFKDKIRQEISTKKYLHTLKTRDLQKKQKQEKKYNRMKKCNH